MPRLRVGPLPRPPATRAHEFARFAGADPGQSGVHDGIGVLVPERGDPKQVAVVEAAIKQVDGDVQVDVGQELARGLTGP